MVVAISAYMISLKPIVKSVMVEVSANIVDLNAIVRNVLVVALSVNIVVKDAIVRNVMVAVSADTVRFFVFVKRVRSIFVKNI